MKIFLPFKNWSYITIGLVLILYSEPNFSNNFSNVKFELFTNRFHIFKFEKA